MGRKKKYNRVQVIDQALQLFHEHGFAGTSTEMLSQNLGINRYSLYAEFGSKQGLFDAAIERYRQGNLEALFSPLNDIDAGLETICSILSAISSPQNSQASGRGCLLCNTVVEFGSHHPGETNYASAYFDQLSGRFEQALHQAASRGELAQSVDIRREADFLASTVLGLFVFLRGNAPRQAIENAGAVAVAHVEKLRA